MDTSKEVPTHAKQSLRVWLRLLSATTVMEKRIRSYLTSEFNSTLPRFDVLAALDREEAPITMSELTAHLLVTNGNLTGLVNRLVDDGYIAREVDEVDRRAQRVMLTKAGRKAFAEMARPHEELVDSFFACLSDEQMETMLELTTILNASLRRRED